MSRIVEQLILDGCLTLRCERTTVRFHRGVEPTKEEIEIIAETIRKRHRPSLPRVDAPRKSTPRVGPVSTIIKFKRLGIHAAVLNPHLPQRADMKLGFFDRGLFLEDAAVALRWYLSDVVNVPPRGEGAPREDP